MGARSGIEFGRSQASCDAESRGRCSRAVGLGVRQFPMQRVGAQLNFFVPGDCQVGSYVDLFDAARVRSRKS